MIETTFDSFLGGKVQVHQPRDGYRAGTDPVLMAAACPAAAGESVLELGCGVGVASLCLLARVPQAQVTGLELQPDYAALARSNGQGLPFEVIVGDVAAPPAELSALNFDHVICNPPYFAPKAGTASTNASRETALREDVSLATWIDVATRRLRPRGTLTMILRADRLDSYFQAIDARMGSHIVLPLTSRAQKPAQRVIFCSRKGGRAGLQMCPPMVLHEGPQHFEDGDDFTKIASDVLRGGAAIHLK